MSPNILNTVPYGVKGNADVEYPALPSVAGAEYNVGFNPALYGGEESLLFARSKHLRTMDSHLFTQLTSETLCVHPEVDLSDRALQGRVQHSQRATQARGKRR